MGIFSTAKSAISKIFGHKKAKIQNRRSETDAAVGVLGQIKRRDAMIKRRIAEGKSKKVYRNKKQVGPAMPITVGDQRAWVTQGRPVHAESPYIEGFLKGYPFSQFASSNVETLVYDAKTQALHVQYLRQNRTGRWYRYGQMSDVDARVAYNTASKGVFSWETLRGKKPTTKDSSPPAYLPLP